MRPMIMMAVWIALLIPHAAAQRAAVEDADSTIKLQLYQKVFGESVRLDPAMVERARAAGEGKYLYHDGNGDGRLDEIWFIDPDRRHPESYRPLLVRVIDEDGDLREGDLPDLDSDLYIADWHADGEIDVVTDYADDDGDQDVDEMGLYFYGDSHNYFNEPVLRVWWARDVGDDNRLLYDIAYTYNQTLCQYRSHFGGDETIYAFAIPLGDAEWTPFWENPFEWYNHDRDLAAEEVLRLSGIDQDVEAYRHSFDVDNDSSNDAPRDFDISMTAWASGARWTKPDGRPGLSEVRVPADITERFTLRGIPTRPVIRHDKARDFSLQQVWERAMMTWDEVDFNVDGQRGEDIQERWEGIIAHGNPDFPQVGGPSCGPYNKRYELILKPAAPLELYYHPVDRRIHLRRADKAWLETDYDFDGKPEMRYEYLDRDQDGVVDAWTIDVDLDGKPDVTCEARAEVRPLRYEWQPLNAAFGDAAGELNPMLWQLNQALAATLAAHGDPAREPVAELLATGFKNTTATAEMQRRLIGSDETIRYYQELLRDRLMARLDKLNPSADVAASLLAARQSGDWPALTSALTAQLDPAPAGEAFEDWLARARDRSAERRVAWRDDWLPPNMAWETEQASYRTYNGQFDFFGKNRPELILPLLKPDEDYHHEISWGMDALLVGKGGGCGGLTLFVNGEAYPVRSPEGRGDVKFAHRVLAESNDRLEFELLATQVGPRENPYAITFRIQAIAGHAAAPIEVTVTGGKPGDKLKLGIGLTRLKQETVLEDAQAGVLGVWGAQAPEIGWIGMGVIYPPERRLDRVDTDLDHLVVLSIERDRPLQYAIQCAWARGIRFNRAPGAADWLAELRLSAPLQSAPH